MPKSQMKSKKSCKVLVQSNYLASNLENFAPYHAPLGSSIDSIVVDFTWAQVKKDESWSLAHWAK